MEKETTEGLNQQAEDKNQDEERSGTLKRRGSRVGCLRT